MATRNVDDSKFLKTLQDDIAKGRPSLRTDTRSIAPHPLLDFFRPFICPSPPGSDPSELQSMQVFSRPLDLSLPLPLVRSLGQRRKGGEF